MKKLSLKLLGSCLVLSLAACGGAETEPEEIAPVAEDGRVSAMATCYAYLLDGANFSGPSLAPFPVTGAVGECITLPLQSDNLTSSFRLAGCGAIFFDGRLCTGDSHAAPTSANMPASFDNRATSLRFY
ncbi:hypothetical protein [Hyalangium minutum]|uniref:Lipoprotein n=1 Tax=Hyalangium minutum TaxID=394096 RepID=A0A085WFJ4_9BACT|nr:hypothetical protein [Hyalangium minutum]KFE66457.1 hypothetical protein DB31_0930 [Hyalangium minutum]